MDHKIIADETISQIKSRNPNLISPEQNGTRKVSLALLSPASSASSRSTSSTFSYDANTPTEPQLRIPERLHSVATYQYLGFTTDQAEKLFRGWKREVGMVEWATKWIVAKCDDITDSKDDWSKAMVEAGINDHIRLTMLKPEHRTILYIQTLSEWLIELIDTAYDALVDMNADILLRITAPSGEPLPTLRGGADELEWPEMPGGHLAVYKSIEHRRTKGCFKEDGSVDLVRLSAMFPTDFAHRGGLYFTHQLWVARHYASLITDACPVADRRTIELHVPLDHFIHVGEWSLPFGPKWKELVYYSRRQETYPRSLSKEKAPYGVIKGPIAHTHNRSFTKMSSPEEITAAYWLQKEEVDDNGKKYKLFASQHIWMNEASIMALQDAVKDKAYLRRPEQKFLKIERPWEDSEGKIPETLD